MSHRDGGVRCLVIHRDASGARLPSCIRCGQCLHWIRPENLHEYCPAQPPPSGSVAGVPVAWDVPEDAFYIRIGDGGHIEIV